MPYTVVPFEGSSRHHRSLGGDLLVSVPQYPDVPSPIWPVMVVQSQVPASDPTTILRVRGNLSTLHVGWDPNEYVIILQDPTTGDILQTFVDLSFELRDALIFLSKDHFLGNSGYALPYDDVKRRVHAYLESWISHNPWALISAFATGRYANVLRAGSGLGPEYGKYAISGFTMSSFMTALGKMSVQQGASLRWVGDNDPFKEGHLEYHVDPTETDQYLWGIRVVGSITIRYRTGLNPIGIIGFGRNLKDFVATRYDPDLTLGTPTFPDGTVPGVDLGPVDPITPSIIIDPDPDPDPDPKPDPDPDPPTIPLDDKKVALNNFLTGLVNFSHNSKPSENSVGFMANATHWKSVDTSEGIFDHHTNVSNAETGFYPDYGTDEEFNAPVASTGDDNESAILFLARRVKVTSAYTALFDNMTADWIGEKLFDLGSEATADLFETMRLLIRSLDSTDAVSVGPPEDAPQASLVKTKSQFNAYDAFGANYSVIADSNGMGIRSGRHRNNLSSWWSDDPEISHADLVTWLTRYGKSEFQRLGAVFVEWPWGMIKSTTGGSSKDVLATMTFAKYVSFIGFTPSAENTAPLSIGTSFNPII